MWLSLGVNQRAPIPDALVPNERPTGRPFFVVLIPHEFASTLPVMTVLLQIRENLGVYTARR